MLTKINKHFFPEIDRPINQAFIHLYDEIEQDNCSDAIRTILDANQPSIEEDDEGVWFNPPSLDVINVMITSPGGNMAAAFALINVIKGSAIPIRTIALGEASSAGLCILMAGHQRVVTPYTGLMSHVFSTGIEGSYHEIINANKAIGQYHEKMMQFYVDSTGLDPKVIRRSLLSKKDHHLTIQQALDYNIADICSTLE